MVGIKVEDRCPAWKTGFGTHKIAAARSPYGNPGQSMSGGFQVSWQ
jgi:hypothetical protein